MKTEPDNSYPNDSAPPVGGIGVGTLSSDKPRLTYVLTLRADATPYWETVPTENRLKAALKSLKRRYGFTCTDCRAVVETKTETKTDA